MKNTNKEPITQEQIDRCLQNASEIEEEVAILQDRINALRTYLTGTKLEDLDADMLEDLGDVEKGLKHIELY